MSLLVLGAETLGNEVSYSKRKKYVMQKTFHIIYMKMRLLILGKMDEETRHVCWKAEKWTILIGIVMEISMIITMEKCCRLRDS